MTMGFELERVLYEAEDFLLRNLRSGSAREARKRRAQRKFQEWLRRVRRSALLLALMLAALVATSIFVAPIGFLTWLVAIPTVLLLAFLALFWPTRRPAPDVQGTRVVGFAELAERAAEGLLDRSEELPGRAIPAVDAIIARLHELAPHLGALGEDALLAGEARRLVGQHLPRLIDTYLALPSSERHGRSDSSRHLTESLETVALELDDLLEQCCRDRQLSFDTQRRFIATRYGEDDALRSK
jgi:hypothetical protein